MKATLYALPHAEHAAWHISLDFAVDCRYRFARQHAAEMLVLSPSLPFGHALLLKRALQAKSAHLPPDGKLLRKLQRYLRRCGLADIAAAASVRIVGKDEWLGQAASLPIVAGEPPDEMIVQQLTAAMSGRSLLPEEIIAILEYMGHKQAAGRWKSYVQAAYCLSAVDFKAAVEPVRISGKRLFGAFGQRPQCRCCRCGGQGKALRWTDCAACGQACPYCEACLMLGRARLCTPLVAGLPGWRNADTAPLPWTELTPGRIAVAAEPLTDYAIQYYQNRWKEMLSGAQLTASMLALQYITAPQRARLPRAGAKGPANRLRRFLLWAVTGAGKTEMLFPLIDHALVSGKTAAIATPRRDVVLELAPRLQKAFPAAHVVALYGGGNSAWESGEITVTTTHQLLRFAAAFDLVIVDEVDAYPFHNNPMLEYAVAKACRPGGAFVFVSATPPRRLRKDAQRGKIGQAILPARYHRQPLPVPRRVRCPSVDKLLTRHTVFGGVRALPKALARRIGFSLARGASVFLFVPYIRQVEPIAARLRVAFPAATVAGTSSEDAEREQKVLNFRRGIINILVTTTILERGVTIPRADVLVLDAHSPLFDDAALIQMSGRAGRASDDPNGNVTFAAPENTLSQQRAIRHIRKMNRLAWRQGLVDPPR